LTGIVPISELVDSETHYPDAEKHLGRRDMGKAPVDKHCIIQGQECQEEQSLKDLQVPWDSEARERIGAPPVIELRVLD
jgi:hypothetical protein